MNSAIFFAVFLKPSVRKAGCSVLLSLGLLSGCFNAGHPFPAGQVSSIRIGETRQNDIYTAFGTPWRTGLDNGFKTWTYGDYRYNLLGDMSAEDLVIKFDKHGVVSSFSYNTSKRSR